MKSRIYNLRYYLLIITTLIGSACAHYPVNKPLSSYNPDNENMRTANESNERAILLTFCRGGMRATAFSYGVLDELKDTRIVLKGKDERLLDEVTAISSVSGGSFTAMYYGLFGEGIFQDFERKFL